MSVRTTTTGPARWKPLAVAAAETAEASIPEIELCARVAAALHGYAISALRLEQRLEELSTALGVPGQFFVTPTAVFASYRIPGKVRAYTQLLRLKPGSVDLGRLAEVEALIDHVRRGGLDVPTAQAALDAIVGAAGPGHPAWWVASAAAISAAAASFFGAGPADVAVAALMGVAIGIVEQAVRGRTNAQRVVPPAVAAFVALATFALARLLPDLSVPTAQLASLIVLVPGLDFTLAIKEVATANLISGAARLVSAVGEFLALGFGIALGTQVATAVFGPHTALEPTGLPGWTLPLAFVVAALGFGGRFHVHRRDMPWVWVACALGYGGAALGTRLLGAPLGAFVGAVLVGLGSNLHARRSGRSPLVMMVPGIILLVPGSVGFRSFALLLRHDVISAVETAFAMTLTATALSTGLLLANVILPSDRAPAPAGSWGKPD